MFFRCRRSLACNILQPVITNVIAMKTELIRIGNSRGIRIPKPMIEQCGLEGQVDLRVERNHVVISAARSPRQGWEEQFQPPGQRHSDEILLKEELENEFDHKEWRWASAFPMRDEVWLIALDPAHGSEIQKTRPCLWSRLMK